jgi:flagellar biosynthesis protein FlhG
MNSSKPTIIPVASGKGGVGKSIFAANLAIALAQMGHAAVVADLDLGGSNLYTCLGMQNKYPGIGDYLRSGTLQFSDLIVQTPIPNLKFLPGDGRTPFTANISYEQRIRLIEEIKKISARYIILDLGAGTMFNILNFYGLAYKGMMITTFETPSIMNFIMFLRNFMFRVVSNGVRHNRKVLDMLIAAFQQPMTVSSREPLTVPNLLKKIGEIDPNLAAQVQKTCSYYRPRIIFNMGDHPDELNILKKLDHALTSGLSVTADWFGFIFFDDAVRRSAKRKEILMVKYPESIAAENIKRIAARVAANWDRPIPNSAEGLMEDTRKQYRKRSEVRG